MGLFDSFEKLHVSIKSMILSIIAIIPFYFISIYLFDYKLLKSFENKYFFINDFQVVFIFSLCFTLSLTWVINNVFLSVGLTLIAERFTKIKSDADVPFILTFFYSVCYLTLAIIINFYFAKFGLLKFVFLSHLFLFIRILWSYTWFKWLKTGDTPNEY